MTKGDIVNGENGFPRSYSITRSTAVCRVAAEPVPTERVFILFADDVDESLFDKESFQLHHVFEDLSAVSATVPVSAIPYLKQDPKVVHIEADPLITVNSQYNDLITADQAKRQDARQQTVVQEQSQSDQETQLDGSTNPENTQPISNDQNTQPDDNPSTNEENDEQTDGPINNGENDQQTNDPTNNIENDDKTEAPTDDQPNQNNQQTDEQTTNQEEDITDEDNQKSK